MQSGREGKDVVDLSEALREGGGGGKGEEIVWVVK